MGRSQPDGAKLRDYVVKFLNYTRKVGVLVPSKISC
jgi:hypothetical protein